MTFSVNRHSLLFILQTLDSAWMFSPHNVDLIITIIMQHIPFDYNGIYGLNQGVL